MSGAGRTPASVTLSTRRGYFRGESYSVTTELAGHEPRHSKIEPSLDPAYLFNVLLGGLVGMLVVDPATGAMWRFERSHGVRFDYAAPAHLGELSGPEDDEVSVGECYAYCVERMAQTQEQCLAFCGAPPQQ